MSIEIVEQSQDLYDAWNRFIISSDEKLFGKMLARAKFVDMTKSVPGDIVECGVFKGSGMFTFLKLKKFLCPNQLKKVIGFDYFDSTELIETLSGLDKDAMTKLFVDREFEYEDKSYEALEMMIQKCGFKSHEFDLVKGDISETAYEYVDGLPGFRISLLYMDLDLAKPTYDTLRAFWNKVSSGGVVVFDEYAHGSWSEANGVDSFFLDKKIEIITTPFLAPSAYIIKE
jgi:hypothetical protein